MLQGLGVVGKRYDDIFVVGQGRYRSTQDFRSGPEQKWQTHLPLFDAICDEGHECEYLLVELLLPINKLTTNKRCKKCQTIEI